MVYFQVPTVTTIINVDQVDVTRKTIWAIIALDFNTLNTVYLMMIASMGFTVTQVSRIYALRSEDEISYVLKDKTFVKLGIIVPRLLELQVFALRCFQFKMGFPRLKLLFVNQGL